MYLKEWTSDSRISFEEWKKRRVERICPVCGKKFYVPKARARIGKGVYCSRKCSYIGYCRKATERRIALATLNSKHPISWNRLSEYLQELHEILGDRCAICGYKGRLELHHIYYAEDSVKGSKGHRLRRVIEALEHPERFVLLCKACHSAVTLVENHGLQILDKIREIVLLSKIRKEVKSLGSETQKEERFAFTPEES